MPIGKRKRANNENADPDEKMIPNNELKLMVENIQENQKSILEKLEKLNKTDKKESETDKKPSLNSITRKMEDLSKIIEEDRVDQKSIMDKLENQQKVLEKLEKFDSSEAKKKTSLNSVISPGSLMKKAPSTRISPIGRSFVLKHTFKDVSKFEERKLYNSKFEDHFGDSWCLSVSKLDQHIYALLFCEKAWRSGNRAITTMFALRMFGVNGQIFSREFGPVIFDNSNGKDTFKGEGHKVVAWEELEKNYLVDDKLAMEMHVEISEISGVYNENLRSFDETKKNYSDVVLKVKNQKFYISKLFLASHSPFFDALFLGPYLESNQSEIELSGIFPVEFQMYLEALYGDPAIDDTTVEGILLVADMYDTSTVIRKCEDYLYEKSQKTMKKKLQMAMRYNLVRLKNNCLFKIETMDDLKSVSPEDPKDLDHSSLVELYKKSLSLQ